VRAVLGVLRRIERWSLNRADHLIVLSQAMADSLTALGIRTLWTILPPQVDCEAIRPLPRPQNAPPTLMYSGNLGRKQGLGQLLDLAAVLLRDAPEIVIIVRGEGAMKADMIARIAQEKLDNVRMMPLVPVERISEALAEGDVHLVPQIADGGDFAVPSKAFAIMAAGRPFVTTAGRDSSIARLAEDSAAFDLVPPYDAQAFADAVIALLGDVERRRVLGENGRRYAETHADTDVVMRRTLRILQDSRGSASIDAKRIGNQ
jgi:colanic acid biosynthesis glycosyl transferase WcaI